MLYETDIITYNGLHDVFSLHVALNFVLQFWNYNKYEWILVRTKSRGDATFHIQVTTGNKIFTKKDTFNIYFSKRDDHT